MTELKKCPFCGGRAMLKMRSTGHGGGKIRNAYQVTCINCGVNTPMFESAIWQDENGVVHVDENGAAQAAESWNRRETARIMGNKVDLCKTCEKNYERCHAYEKDYAIGEQDQICCCGKYMPWTNV